MTFESELNPIPEPKYYTPTIEEFHVGFEYEVIAEDFGIDSLLWLKHNNPYRIEILKNFIESNDVRVKYLDREDIESLGWEPDFERSWCVTNFKDSYDRHICFKKKNAGLIYRIDKGFVTIKNENQYLQLLIEGSTYKIKNKSELKKLMQQLNITE